MMSQILIEPENSQTNGGDKQNEWVYLCVWQQQLMEKFEIEISLFLSVFLA